MKRLYLVSLFLAAVLLAGCQGKVRHSMVEDYPSRSPVTVVVMPVVWEDSAPEGPEREEVESLWRGLSVEGVRRLGYTVPGPEVADRRYEPGPKLDPAEAARSLGADGVMYVFVEEWDTDVFVTYASFSIGARFELYSKEGERLWRASYSTSESDVALTDRERVEYSVLKTYEPRVQRVVDAVLSTLPSPPAGSESEGYFDWLP